MQRRKHPEGAKKRRTVRRAALTDQGESSMLSYEDVVRNGLGSGEWRAIHPTSVVTLGSRVATSTLIVAGEVECIRAASGLPEPSSRHSPRWVVADIRVSAVLKGAHRDWTVSALFPSSRESFWRAAPRLTERQRSLFILHRGETPLAPRELFTLLRSLNVQPLSAVAKLTELVKVRA